MRGLHTFLVITVAAAFLAAGYLILRGFGVLGGPNLATVKEVPEGHQEIAWIAPATSGESWERLVASVQMLQKEWVQAHPGQPALQVSLDKAFLELTADVPEMALSLGDPDHATLWIRWYKLSSEVDSRQWIETLARRSTPPLAIIGGDTSDRALNLAQILKKNEGAWSGASPLFLVTTATADNYRHLPNVTDPDHLPKLMEVYPGLTFRFAFRNKRMAEAVLEFIQQRPDIWSFPPGEAAIWAGWTALADPWARPAFTAASLQHVFTLKEKRVPWLYYLTWEDEEYSKDLGLRFGRVFQQLFHRSPDNSSITYSAGDYYQPNPREEIAVNLFLNFHRIPFRQQPQILALPTGSQRARRFLRTLCRQAPQEIRNLVVVSGDSITFNQIYRDREVAWDVRDLPTPLIFFCHRNPIDPGAGFGKKGTQGRRQATTSTQDLLFYRDIVEAVIQAAFQETGLLNDAQKVQERLAQLRWRQQRVHSPGSSAVQGPLLFDADGNRNPGTGEHVVWLKPKIEGDRNLAQASISVWFMETTSSGPSWKQFGLPLEVHYGRLPGAEDPYAGD